MVHRRPSPSGGGLRLRSGGGSGALAAALCSIATVFGIGLVIASVMFSTGAVAVTVDRPPMSDSERAARRGVFLDRLWRQVETQYPEALRPDVRIGRVVDDRGRLTAIASCLQDAGIVAAIDRGRLSYSNRAGQTPLDVAVSYYVCAATYPTIQDVTVDLDPRQLGSLWDYYTMSLRPCLAAAGVRTWTPPNRAEFTAADGYHTWNPYLPLAGGRLPHDDLVPLERRCHAIPGWLDFRTA